MNVLRALISLSIIVISYSCSSDDDAMNPIDNRVFNINNNTGYFINLDETVNLIVSATIQDDGNFGDVINRGIAYGTSSKPEVGSNNISVASGSFDSISGYIKGLTKGLTYFIRGYFEYSDGTFFYGNEIQASTDVEASTSRDLTLTIESQAVLIQVDFITVTLNINDVMKEMPVEIGIEYSINNDFTNSSTNSVGNFDGIHNQGNIVVTSYSAVAESLLSKTQYYFRPYAKYADGTVTNGGTSTASFTTN